MVSVPSGVRVLSSHGLAVAEGWLGPDAAAKVRRALEDRTAVGGSVPPIALASGESATSMVCVPIPQSEEPRVLIALRARPPFTPDDAAPMSKAAELFAMRPPQRFPWPALVTAFALANAAVLVAAIALDAGTVGALILAGPLVGVAGATARGGRIALRIALALSVLAVLDRASAQFLYGNRGEVAFGLEVGGALIALAAVLVSLAALRARETAR